MYSLKTISVLIKLNKKYKIKACLMIDKKYRNVIIEGKRNLMAATK